jgi:hypothetical protein
LAANHNSAATRVQLATGSGQARLQKLTDGEQAKDREFWKNSPVELCAPGEIELPAGGIVRIELI